MRVEAIACQDTEMEVGEMLIPPSAARKFAANTHTATPWFSASGGWWQWFFPQLLRFNPPEVVQVCFDISYPYLRLLIASAFSAWGPRPWNVLYSKTIEKWRMQPTKISLASCMPALSRTWLRTSIPAILKSDPIQRRQFKLTIHPNDSSKSLQPPATSGTMSRIGCTGGSRIPQTINLKKSSFHGVTIQFHPNFLGIFVYSVSQSKQDVFLTSTTTSNFSNSLCLNLQSVSVSDTFVAGESLVSLPCKIAAPAARQYPFHMTWNIKKKSQVPALSASLFKSLHLMHRSTSFVHQDLRLKTVILSMSSWGILRLWLNRCNEHHLQAQQRAECNILPALHSPPLLLVQLAVPTSVFCTSMSPRKVSRISSSRMKDCKWRTTVPPLQMSATHTQLIGADHIQAKTRCNCRCKEQNLKVLWLCNVFISNLNAAM